MDDPFIGDIKLFPGTVAPQGWAPCNGGMLSVNREPVLYSVIGNTYGGTPGANFNLPKLDKVTDKETGKLSYYYIAINGLYPERR